MYGCQKSVFLHPTSLPRFPENSALRVSLFFTKVMKKIPYSKQIQTFAGQIIISGALGFPSNWQQEFLWN